jgi:hypothetical protein
VKQQVAVLAVAAAAIAGVLAQYFYPQWTGFHSWQYSGILLLAAFPLFGFIGTVRGGGAGPRGGRALVAVIGALICIAAGIGSGLLGPDSETFARAPGTTLTLSDSGVEATFPNVDAGALARGDSRVVLRRHGSPAGDVGPGGRRFVNASALELRPQTAAYVEARDRQGRHLTITQPTGAAFLSPVLMFADQIPLSGKMFPSDQFAAPAARRQIRAVLFNVKDLPAGPHGMTAASQAKPNGEALLFAVGDELGRGLPNGIGFVPPGKEMELGGIRLRATLGTYPALVTSSVPPVFATWIGGLCFLAGLIAFALPVAPATPPQAAERAQARARAVSPKRS